MAYPRFRLARAHKFFTRTAGDLVCNGTAWADLPTIGTTWDITLSAQVGDTLMATVSYTPNAALVYLFLDAVTIVSGAPVTSFATGVAPSASAAGVKAWMATGNVATDGGRGGSVMYTVQAGDLASGYTTVRLRVRTGTAAAKSLQASANDPFQFSLVNLGPADPN